MDLADREEVILMIMMIMNAARLVWIGVGGSISGGFGSGEVAVHFCCRLLSLSHSLCNITQAHQSPPDRYPTSGFVHPLRILKSEFLFGT